MKQKNKLGRTDMILRDPKLDLQEGSIVVLKSLIVDPGIPGDYKKIAESMGIGPLRDICCWPVGVVNENQSDFDLFEEEDLVSVQDEPALGFMMMNRR